MTDTRAPLLRRLLRVLALSPVVLVVAGASPALADMPEQWQDTTPVSGLHVLLLLVAIPLGLFALITFLVMLPSMVRGERYSPGQPWRHESEWFGGPRAGVAAADTTEPPALDDPQSGVGGVSARW